MFRDHRIPAQTTSEIHAILTMGPSPNPHEYLLWTDHGSVTGFRLKPPQKSTLFWPWVRHLIPMSICSKRTMGPSPDSGSNHPWLLVLLDYITISFYAQHTISIIHRYPSIPKRTKTSSSNSIRRNSPLKTIFHNQTILSYKTFVSRARQKPATIRSSSDIPKLHSPKKNISPSNTSY